MPDLFSPYTLKGVTLRNRIAMSPMTMYRSVDGLMNDFHVMMLGARAAGGFGLVFAEQLAITPDGRTSTSCGGIYDDAQIEGLARVTRIIKDMGAVAAAQLGHTGRKGSELKPWEGGAQLPPDHPDGWQVSRPLAHPLRRQVQVPVHELTRAGDQGHPPSLRRRRRGGRTRPASSGWSCTSPMATSAPASSRRWPTSAPTNTAAAWKTGCASTPRRSTPCARSGPSGCR